MSAEALPIMSRIRTFIHWKKWYYPSKCAFIFRFYVSCMGFPDCRTAIWLPDGVLEAKPTDSACEKVQIRLLEICKIMLNKERNT